jgi:hypothetical protein
MFHAEYVFAAKEASCAVFNCYTMPEGDLEGGWMEVWNPGERRRVAWCPRCVKRYRNQVEDQTDSTKGYVLIIHSKERTVGR